MNGWSEGVQASTGKRRRQHPQRQTCNEPRRDIELKNSPSLTQTRKMRRGLAKVVNGLVDKAVAANAKQEPIDLSQTTDATSILPAEHSTEQADVQTNARLHMTQHRPHHLLQRRSHRERKRISDCNP